MVEGLSLNGPEDAALLAELYGPATELVPRRASATQVSAEDAATLRDCVDGRRGVGAGPRRSGSR